MIFDEDYELRKVCWVKVEEGDIEVAEKIAQLIKDEDIQSETLVGMVHRLVSSGNLEVAEKIACSIKCETVSLCNYDKVRSLLLISSYWIKLGDREKIKKLMMFAEKAANNIEEIGWQKAESLCRIARMFAMIQYEKHALKLLQEATNIAEMACQISEADCHDCEGVLGEISTNFIKLGNVEEGEKIRKTLKRFR